MTWQQSLATLITNPAELLNLLDLPLEHLECAQRASQLFPLKVPLSFVNRMTRNNLKDPLLQQVLPLGLEFNEKATFSKDPLEERNFNPVPGVLHKYANRILITLTSACGVHCRYCFRRFFPYGNNRIGRAGFAKIVDYLKKHPEVNEIILSGGDPLVSPDSYLNSFTQALQNLTQIKRLRIHSRLPIVIPARITSELLQWLYELPFQTIFVTHVNHAQEIDSEVAQAMQLLKQTVSVLLNQTVLLKNINDNAQTLKILSERLFECGVLPYYLHVLDPVAGTTHFEIPLTKAKAIHQELMSYLPGFLVPRLVQEQPGKPSKTVLS